MLSRAINQLIFLFLFACLALPAAAQEGQKIQYSGMLSCGDTSTFVSFVYNAQTKTLESFTTHDICINSLPKRLFRIDGRSIKEVLVVGKWTASQPISVNDKGEIRYWDEMGYQVSGRFEGGQVLFKGVKVPGRTATGVLGRPKTKLIQCTKGQFYLPCSKWQAAIED